MADDQREVIAFLGDPPSYGANITAVERLKTHISLVFLAGARAYKLKRSVKFPYLDFTTVGQRRRFCARATARSSMPSHYGQGNAVPSQKSPTRPGCGLPGCGSTRRPRR